jgi:hypothetical protein
MECRSILVLARVVSGRDAFLCSAKTLEGRARQAGRR